jgi:hypothetical protein
MARRPQTGSDETETDVEDETGTVQFGGGDGGGDDENEEVDLSQTGTGGFELIPRGIYNAIVDEVEYTTSSKGNKMWSWVFEIQDEPYDRRKLFFHTTFNEGGLPRVKQALMKLGRADLANGRFNPKQVAEEGILVGLPVRLRVGSRVWKESAGGDGEMRNDVRGLLSATDTADGAGTSFINS